MAIKTNSNIRVSESGNSITISFNNSKSWTSVTLSKEYISQNDVYLLLSPNEDKLERLFENYYSQLCIVKDNFKRNYKKYLKELSEIDNENKD